MRFITRWSQCFKMVCMAPAGWRICPRGRAWLQGESEEVCTSGGADEGGAAGLERGSFRGGREGWQHSVGPSARAQAHHTVKANAEADLGGGGLGSAAVAVPASDPQNGHLQSVPDSRTMTRGQSCGPHREYTPTPAV